MGGNLLSLSYSLSYLSITLSLLRRSETYERSGTNHSNRAAQLRNKSAQSGTKRHKRHKAAQGIRGGP
jgi:hypothetical protein